MSGIFSAARSFLSIVSGSNVLEAEERVQSYELKSKKLPPLKLESLPRPTKGKGKGKGKTEKKDPPKAPKLSEDKRRELLDRGACELLILFQREGRLVDFLDQEIEDFDDEEVGAAVRDIHKGCRKVLKEHFEITPVMDGEEGESTTVKKGFRPEEVRLVGNVKGDPPFKGTLEHAGWKATRVTLPKVAESVDARILARAEVEL